MKLLFVIISFLSVSSVVYSQEKVKEVIDGKLDEHRVGLEEALRGLNYPKFDLPKTSRTRYDYHHDWVKWVRTKVLGNVGGLEEKNRQYIEEALLFHFSTINNADQILKKSDKHKGKSYATLVATRILMNRAWRRHPRQKDNMLGLVRKHASYKKLNAAGRYLILAENETPSVLIDAFAEWLSDDNLNNKESLEIICGECILLCKKYCDKIRYKKLIKEKLINHPKIPKTLKHLLLGMIIYDDAWKIRGGSYAHKVPKENMKKFMQGLVLAKKEFIKAWELYPKNIDAIRMIIAVAMADGTEDIRVWLNRGMAVYLDDLDLIRAYRRAIEPKWGGSVEQQFGFAIAISLIEKENSRLPEYANHFLALRLLMGTPADERSPILIWLVLENSKRMMKVQHPIYANYLGLFVKQAMMFKRYDALVADLDEYKKRSKELNDDPQKAAKALDLILLYKKGAMKLKSEGISHLKNGRYEEALKVQKKIKAMMPEGKVYQELYRDFYYLAKVNLELRQNIGEWVDYTTNKYSFHDRLANVREHGLYFALSKLETTASYEYEVTLDEEKILSNYGLVVGFVRNQERKEGAPFDFLGCNLEYDGTKKGILRITKNFEEVKEWKVEVPTVAKNILKVKVQDGKLTVFCNGKKYFEEIEFKGLNEVKDKDGKQSFGKVGLYSLPQKACGSPNTLRMRFLK